MRWMLRRKEKENESFNQGGRTNPANDGESIGFDPSICEIRARPRNNRIRYFSRCTGRHCNYCNHAVSSKTRRAVECHRRRYQWFVRQLHAEDGQSSVEFALITAGFLALIVTLGLLWHVFSDGLATQHVLSAASHHLKGIPAPNIADIFRY